MVHRQPISPIYVPAPNVFEYAAIVGGSDVNYTGGDTPQRLQGHTVSSDWFAVFGAKPLIGRLFTPEEDQPNSNRVAVFSYAAWTRLFGADRNVIGRTVSLNQISYQIVGVMKPEFQMPRGTDVWMPIGLQPEAYTPRNRFNESFFSLRASNRAYPSSRRRPGWVCSPAACTIPVQRTPRSPKTVTGASPSFP